MDDNEESLEDKIDFLALSAFTAIRRYHGAHTWTLYQVGLEGDILVKMALNPCELKNLHAAFPKLLGQYLHEITPTPGT